MFGILRPTLKMVFGIFVDQETCRYCTCEKAPLNQKLYWP